MTRHFAYPNVNLDQSDMQVNSNQPQYLFSGCGRFIAFATAELPKDRGYIFANPKINKIAELREAVSILAPDSVRTGCKVYEVKDRSNEIYKGESKALAYFLALINRSRAIKIKTESDIWCTGWIHMSEGKRPCLNPVKFQEFRVKLKSFLSEENNDNLFVIHDSNIDEPDVEKQLKANDVKVFTLEEFQKLKEQEIQNQKIILLVPSFGLEALIEIIFEPPLKIRKYGVFEYLPIRFKKSFILIFIVISLVIISFIWMQSNKTKGSEEQFEDEIFFNLDKNGSAHFIKIDTLTKSAAGMTFIRIPGGCYKMGCEGQEAECFPFELPLHTVCLDNFWMGKYEVTQEEWKKVMEVNPSSFIDCGMDCPVENVSWEDVTAFISRLNRKKTAEGLFRLPTEAEWEYTCKRMENREETAKLNDSDTICPVMDTGGYASGLKGLKDNVLEWCSDTFGNDAYQKHRNNNPQHSGSSPYKTVRGRSWSIPDEYVPCTHRFKYLKTERFSDVGFRLVWIPYDSSVQEQ